MESLAVGKKFSGAAIFAVLALLFLGRPALAAQDPWPKRFEHPQGTVVMYQPQLEDFQDDRLMGRAAVSVRKKEWKAPVFGAVWLSGRVRPPPVPHPWPRTTDIINISQSSENYR